MFDICPLGTTAVTVALAKVTMRPPKLCRPRITTAAEKRRRAFYFFLFDFMMGEKTFE